MTAPSYVGRTDGVAGQSAISVPVVTGSQADDLLLIFLEIDDGDSASTPSGWMLLSGFPVTTTSVGGTSKGYVFWKIHSGSQGSVTIADAGDHQVACMVAYRGVNTASPIDVLAVGSPLFTQNYNCPSVTTTGPDRRIVCVGWSGLDFAYTNTSPPWASTTMADEVGRYTYVSNTGGGGGWSFGDGTLPSAGASGVVEYTAPATGDLIGATIAIAPINNINNKKRFILIT